MHSPDEGGVDTGTGQRGTFLRFVVEAGILDVLPRYPFLLSIFLFSLSNVEYVMARQLCVRPGGNVILSSVTGAFTESKFLKQKEVAGMEKQLQRPE